MSTVPHAGLAIVERLKLMQIVSVLAQREASPQSARVGSHFLGSRWMSLEYGPSPPARVRSSTWRETR